MIPAGLIHDLSETKQYGIDAQMTRITLDKFQRAKILEVYFARLDGRTPETIPSDCQELYEIELSAIKGYLLGQHPQDSLLQKIFKIVH
jgi:hypothetical protein